MRRNRSALWGSWASWCRVGIIRYTTSRLPRARWCIATDAVTVQARRWRRTKCSPAMPAAANASDAGFGESVDCAVERDGESVAGHGRQPGIRTFERAPTAYRVMAGFEPPIETDSFKTPWRIWPLKLSGLWGREPLAGATRRECMVGRQNACFDGLPGRLHFRHCNQSNGSCQMMGRSILGASLTGNNDAASPPASSPHVSFIRIA